MTPQIILPGEMGLHNKDISATNARLENSKSYRNNSTVIVCPTRGGRSLCARFVSAMQGLLRPMNVPVYGVIYLEGMEVGAAYNSAVEMILGNPNLSKFKFLFCVEDDVIPPPDALLKLYENMDKVDVCGALYWCKGSEGCGMVYGNPNESPLNFIPQKIQPECLQMVNGTGMGCTLLKIDLFKKMERPWFETVQKWDPATGVRCYTQDLHFYERVIRAGGKVAVDTRIKAGHLDIEENILY